MRKREDRFKYLKWAVKLLFLMIIVGAFWWWLFLSSQFQIRHVEVRGAASLSSEKIKSSFYEATRNPLFLFEDKNSLLVFLNRNQILSQLTSKYPPIQQAKLNINISTDQVKITITERSEVGIWSQGKESFYFDSEGVLFRPAPDYQGQIITPVVAKIEKKIKLGDKIAPPELHSAVMELIESDYLQRHLNPARIEIINEAYDLKCTLVDGAELFFSTENTNGNLEKSLYVLEQTMERKVKKTDKKLDYIDLRIGNRAYVKYEEEEDRNP